MLKPSVFTRYFILQFLKLCLFTTLALVVIFSVSDTLNFVQISHAHPKVHLIIFIKLFAYHIIYLTTEAVPFILIIATLFFLIQQHTSRHFTIVRNCGISLSQVMRPIVMTTFILGVIEILLFNPFYTYTQKQYDQLSRRYFAEPSQITSVIESGIWFTIKTADNKKIFMNAQNVNAEQELQNIKIFIFKKGQINKVIKATTGTLTNATYHLNGITIYQNDGSITQQEHYILQTKSLAKRDGLLTLRPLTSPFQSIYSLPKYIKSLKLLGVNNNAAITSFLYILLKPFYYILFILGVYIFLMDLQPRQPYRLKAIQGIITGFSLYIAIKISINFASAGLWNPILAVLGTYIILIATVIYMITTANDT